MRNGWLTALFAAALAAAGVAAQEPRSDAQDTSEAQEGARQAEQQQEPGEAGARTPGAQQSASDDEPSTPDAEASGDETALAEADADEPPYRVECDANAEPGTHPCQVDRATYVGWRTFHAVCHTCHAQDAVGSSFAPALLPRIRMIDKARFVEVVDKGFTGQVGVMPAWGANPNVNRYYDELWAYLRARADGVLPPGRPRRLPDE